MPLYEYRCKQCGHQFEKIQSFSAAELTECPACKGELERLISAPAIQFKGAGWYVNDYAGKGGSKPAAKSGESSSGGDTSSSPASSEGGSSSSAASGSSGSASSSNTSAGSSSTTSSSSKSE